MSATEAALASSPSQDEVNDRFGRDFWLSVLALLAFVLLTSFVGFHHEPWFDEAQAWLIGRDCSLWELLAYRVRYEGSPGAWQALLWLLSHAGYPFEKLWLVSTAFAGAGAWIILRHAPFPFVLRLAIVFSYFVSFQFAAVARSYALDLVLIPLLAVTFEGRLRRPILYAVLLGICANTNAHSFIIAMLLFGDFLWASWRSDLWHRPSVQVAGAVFAIFAGAAVLQTWRPADVNEFWSSSAFGRAGLVLREAFVDRMDMWASHPPSDTSSMVAVWISVALLLPGIWLFWRARNAVLVVAGFLAFLAFSVLTYANVWHAGILYLFWIFGLWVSWDSLRGLSARLAKVILASVGEIVFVNDVYAVMAWTREVQLVYSAGPATARLLTPQASGRIAGAGIKAFAVQPWFDRNVFANYQDGRPDIAYYRWSRDEVFRYYIDLPAWREMVSKDYTTLILSTADIPPEQTETYVTAATAAGFCRPAFVFGAMIWKSYLREDDRMLVFARCK